MLIFVSNIRSMFVLPNFHVYDYRFKVNIKSVASKIHNSNVIKKMVYNFHRIYKNLSDIHKNKTNF